MSTFSKYHIRDFKANYPMGRALIINVLNTETSDGGTDVREGSLEDVKRLNFTFQYLNFKVEFVDDPTGNGIRSEILKFVDSINEEKQDVDMSAVCVMAHGEEGFLFGKDGRKKGKVSIKDDILKEFSNENCHKMIGKPKLFIFQSCRGGGKDEGFSPSSPPGLANNVSDGSLYTSSKSSSVLNDCIEAYSTIPEFAAWRNKEKGSYFIQTLCDVFKENAHKEEIQRLFKLVVSEMKNKKVDTDEGEYVLTPPQVITQGFDKDLFFKPELDEDEKTGKTAAARMTCGLVKSNCSVM